MDRIATFFVDKFGEVPTLVILIFILIFIFLFMCNCFRGKLDHMFGWGGGEDSILEDSGADQIEGFRHFVSNKGTLPDGKYVIKGGRERRYCTDDANGLICNTMTPGPLEMFTIQHLDGEKYAIQGYRSGLWCTQTRTGLRCESPVVGDWEVFRFHPLPDGTYAIQSNRNGQWCADMGNGMVCDIPSMNDWDFQKFEFIPIRYNNIK